MGSNEMSPINDETPILERHGQELSGIGLIDIQSNKNTPSAPAAYTRDHRLPGIHNGTGLGVIHELSHQSMQEGQAGT